MRITIGRCVLIVSAIVLAMLFIVPSSMVLGPAQSKTAGTATVTYTDKASSNYVLEKDFTYARPVLSNNMYVAGTDLFIPGTSNINQPGAPYLPCERVSVAFEPCMTVVKVTVTGSDPEAIPISNVIAPYPKPIPVSSDYEALYGNPEAITSLFEQGPVYSENAYFPAQNYDQAFTFGITKKSNEGRDYIKMSSSQRSQYLDLTLYPVRYNPVEGVALFYEALHLTVEYARNPSYAPAYSTRAESWDMVIITPQSMASKFQVLADYRNTTSIKTRVVTLENVYAGTYFTATGADNPEKIKNFIKSALETWGIDYVILGGDSGQFPVRYAYINDGTGEYTIPSDLYYCDIYKSGGAFADWNADGNSRWGEYSADLNDVDCRPDLILGRIPADSETQAQTIIGKIMNYEIYAYGAAWFKNVTLIGLDTFDASYGDTSGVAEGEYYCTYLATNYYTTARGWSNNKLYDSLGTLSRTNFAKAQNQQVGIMALSDHGNENAWGMYDLDNSDVAAMNNGYKLPIVTIDACLTGALDFTGGDCFAEKFLKNANGGGVSSFAASRIGYGAYGTYHIQGCSGFINRMFHYSYTEAGAERIGEMYEGAQSLYCQYQNEKGDITDYKTICEFMFYGDPTTVIGGFSRTTAKISVDDNIKSVDPGATVQFNVSLENTGPGYAVVSIQTSRSDLTPVPADWTLTFSENPLTLTPYENQTIKMNVTCPLGEDAAEVMDIVFKAVSPNIEGSPLTVTTYTTVNPTYGLNFTCADNQHQIEAQTSTIYYMDLKNTGNGPLTFRLTILDKPSDWQASFSNDTVALARDTIKPISMWVQPGPKVLSGTYEMHIRCYIMESSAVLKELIVQTSILKSNGFSMNIISDTHVEVDGGVMATFTVSLENTGNHVDSVGISFPNKASMSGWLFSCNPAPNVDVPAFGMTEVTAQITPPDGALSDTYDIEVKATLDSDSTIKTTTINVIVKAVYAFEVMSEETVKEVETSSQAKFEYNLHNLGNIQDTYDLTVSGKPTDWVVTMENTLALDPSTEEDLSLTVTAPGKTILAGDYNITLNVKSRASSEVKTIVYTIDIPESYGLDLQCVQTSKEVRPGEKAQIQFTLKSESNCEETFYLTKSGQSTWDAQVTKTQITLKPFCSDTLLLEATPPAGMAIGSYKFTVQAVASSDGLAEDTTDVYVNVKQVYGLSLDVITETESIKDKGNATFKFRLTNLGNGPDTFDITLDGVRSGWDAQTTREFELASLESVTGVLVINVPEDAAEKGTYDIGLFASSKGAKSDGDGPLKDNITFTLEVKRSSGPLPDIIGFNDGGSSGSSMLYVLIIVIVLLIVVAIAIIVIVAARRKKGKKAKPVPAPAPTQPAIHSNKPEYSHTQPTLQSGKQERTPVYAVSKPSPTRSKPAPTRSKPPMRAMPAPPPPLPETDEDEVEFETRSRGEPVQEPVEETPDEPESAPAEDEDSGMEWEEPDAEAQETPKEETQWDDAFEMDDE